MGFVVLQGMTAEAKTAIEPSASSDVYILPAHSNKKIGMSWSSGTTPQIFFTFEGEAAIRAGTAQWDLWDLISEINSAVTGCYITNSELSAITVFLSARVA